MLKFCANRKKFLERLLPLCHGMMLTATIFRSIRFSTTQRLFAAMVLFALISVVYELLPNIWHQLSFELAVYQALRHNVPFRDTILPHCVYALAPFVIGAGLGMAALADGKIGDTAYISAAIFSIIALVYVVLLIVIWLILRHRRIYLARHTNPRILVATSRQHTKRCRKDVSYMTQLLHLDPPPEHWFRRPWL